MLLLSKAAAKAPRIGPGPADPVGPERAIGQVVYQTLRKIARDLPAAVLESGDAGDITRAIDWEAVGTQLMAMSKPLEEVIVAAAREEIPKSQLAKAAVPLDGDPYPIEFALINRLAVEYAESHSGRLVMEISDKMRESIAAVISGTVAGEIPRSAMVRLLRATVPLHSGWADAVTKAYKKTYETAIADGKSLTVAGERAAKVAEVRSERLLQARSKNIARTEAMTAMNQGKFAGWSEQVGQGWMPVDSLKEWIEGRNPCKQCAPLVGQIVPWDEPFSNGQMMPPEHPSCRCTAAMLPPDDEFLARLDPKYRQAPPPVEASPFDGLPPIFEKRITHSGARSLRDATVGANPLRQVIEGNAYRKNCTRVAATVEMRARGFDVQAGPVDLTDLGNSTRNAMWDTDNNWVTDTGKTRPSKVVKGLDALEAEILKGGEGSRYFIAGSWKSGGGHIWNAEVRDGKVYWWEGQVVGSQGVDKKAEYSRHLDTGKDLRVKRVDDLQPSVSVIGYNWITPEGTGL